MLLTVMQYFTFLKRFKHISDNFENVYDWRLRHFTFSQFLGASAKLRKAIISFFMCQSVRMGQLGSHRTDFHEIWYLNIFRKSVDKIQVSLKSDKNNGYITRR